MNNNRLILSLFIFSILISAVSAAALITTDGDHPWIRIDSVGGNGDLYAGDQFTISGGTNLPEGSDLIFEIVSSSYSQADESERGEYTGKSEIIKIVKGATCNEWSIDIDGSDLNPDKYIISVEAVAANSTAGTEFKLLEKVATATATKSATSVATTDVTEIPSTPTETAAPGFGILVTLAGLGVVAALFFRKK